MKPSPEVSATAPRTKQPPALAPPASNRPLPPKPGVLKSPSREAGAQSPVIALAAELRRRHAYPDDFTAWIKAHSSNRFLPHGNLMDKL